MREIPTGKVTFLEGPHVYLNEKNQRYLSVTQLLDTFKEKFDPLEAAQKAVMGKNPKYIGRTVKSVMDEWAGIGEFARTVGTKFHKGKEDTHNKQAYRDQKSTSFIPNPAMIIPTGDDVETDYTWLPDGVYAELIVWNHEYHLAGIADKIIVDGDFFDIEDYKTNSEIKKLPYYEPGKGYKMMKWPLNHIMDASFYHYELQLSLYAFMFALLSGKKARRLTILHHPKEEKMINGVKQIVIREKEERFECKYRIADIKMMLKMWGGFAPVDYKPEVNN